MELITVYLGFFLYGLITNTDYTLTPPDGKNDCWQECQVAEREEEGVEGGVELGVGRGRLVARPAAVPGEALAGGKPARKSAGNSN